MGYDAAYIKRYTDFALQNTTDKNRIEILNAVLSIVRGVNEKVDSN